MADGVAITLLRHGMTEANVKKQYVGWTDSRITEDGLQQLQQLQSSYPYYDCLYCSDSNRCIQTANILFPKCDVILKKEFRELNFGVWEGKTYEQLVADSTYKRWLERPFEIEPPQGESFSDFSQRVKKGWSELVESMESSDSKHAAILTHGGVIRHLLVQYAPRKRPFWDWAIPYGCGYEFYWESFELLRRGETCTSLRAVPIMGKENG